MARNAAKAEGLYYPTPEPIIESIAHYLTLDYWAQTRFLDPCAGKGRALRLLADLMHQRQVADASRVGSQHVGKIETYGIETNHARTRLAEKALTSVLRADYFNTVISDYGFPLVLLNPPYDTDTETTRKNGRQERLEVTFLRRTTRKLAGNGVLIYIIPQEQLRYAASHLAEWYRDIRVWRFPDTPFSTEEMREKGQAPRPMYEMFKQIVLIATKEHVPHPGRKEVIDDLHSMSDSDMEHQVLQPLPERRPLDDRCYEIPTVRYPLSQFLANPYDPDRTAWSVALSLQTHLPQAGVWASPAYLDKHWPSLASRLLSIGQPLAPIKRAHLAILAVAGIANGAVIEGKNGQRVVIKGHSRKVPTRKVTEDEEAVVTTVTDTFETALWCIDMDTGELIRVDTGNQAKAQEGASSPLPFPVAYTSMPLSEFLENFGAGLTRRVAEGNPPLYQGEQQIPWAEAAFKQMLRKPLGKQRDFVLAEVNAFLHGVNRVGEIAEMATGKTFLSLAIAYLADTHANGLAHLFPRRKRKSGSGSGSGSSGKHARNQQQPHLFPAVALVPEIIAYKWKREAEITIPDIKAIVIGRVETPEAHSELTVFAPSHAHHSTTPLSAVGCLEVVIAQIKQDLAAWERACHKARLKGEREMPKKPAHLVIITSSVAKLDMAWEPIYTRKMLRTVQDNKITLLRDEGEQPVWVPCCPDCGKPIRDSVRQERLAKNDSSYKWKLQERERLRAKGNLSILEEETDETTSVFVTEQEIWGTKGTRRKRVCSECGAALWQSIATGNAPSGPGTPKRALPLPNLDREHNPPVLKNTHGRRYALADYIRRRYAHFFKLLITDEVHQGADGTALGYARESLIQSCNTALGLTGTLCNGYASSIFPFFRMVSARASQQFGYHDTKKWVERYGAKQVTTKNYKEKETVRADGAVSKRDASLGKPVEKEIPGFAPSGLEHVLGCCGILELSEVAPMLPPYKEEVHVVPMGQTFGSVYTAFESEITTALGRMLMRGDKSGLSPWLNALMCYPNMPWRGWTCAVKRTGEILGTAPELPENSVYPKEQALIDLVQKERSRGRAVLIYVENTGSLDIMPRLKRLLEQHVKGDRPLKVDILRTDTVKTIQRESWLLEQVDRGCEVLLCNPALVQVGLDLIHFKTIIFYQIPTSTSKMRQAARRSHRPGQNQSVRVIFMVYPTMESRLLRLMARKMKTSLMVEGKLPGEGLVSFNAEEDEGDFMLQLAREVLKKLDESEGRSEDDSEGEANIVEGTLSEAEELQSMFREAAEIEASQNRLIGERDDEDARERPVELEEITTVTLVAPPEMDVAEPVPGPVTIIPINVTGDPWAILRQKAAALEEAAGKGKGKGRRKRAKKGGMSADIPPEHSLWAAMVTSSAITKQPQEPPDPSITAGSEQQTLW